MEPSTGGASFPQAVWEWSPQEKQKRLRWMAGPDGVSRREAENPTTPGARLEIIAQNVYRRFGNGQAGAEVGNWILEAVFAHPNVPPRVVQQCFTLRYFVLTGELLRAFFDNPIAPFVLLEMPDFVLSLPARVQCRLLQEETMPYAMVRQIACQTPEGDAEAVEAARLHVAFAGEARDDEWENEARNYWKTFCARSTGRFQQWHVDLAEMELAPDWAKGMLPVLPVVKPFRQETLQKWFGGKVVPGSDEETLLARRIAPYLQPEFVVRHLRPEASAHDLAALLNEANHKQGLVGRAILNHPAATADLIVRLVRADVKRFGYYAACHPLTPPSIIADFAASPSPEMRRAARRHPNAPPDTVSRSQRAALKFASGERGQHGGEFIRFVQAYHQTGSKHAVTADAGSDAWTIRLQTTLFSIPDALDNALSFGPRTGRDLLTVLSYDGNRIVRAAARTRLANPDYRFVL